MHPEAPSADDIQPEQTPPTLGELLAELRVQAGMSQLKLIQATLEREPEVSGLVASAPAHWERDRRVPSPLHLLLVIRTLKVAGEDFLAVIGAAARREPLFVPGELMLREGRWTQGDWEAWARTFTPRVGRRKG